MPSLTGVEKVGITMLGCFLDLIGSHAKTCTSYQSSKHCVD